NYRRDATSGDEGADLLRAIKRLDPDLPVLLMTAFTSLEAAVQLVKEGASDYIAKPWNDDKLVVSVRNLMRVRELALDHRRLRAPRARARNVLGTALASSNRPTRSFFAPVNAPASAPKSSDSRSSSGRPPAFTCRNGLSRRRELAWTIRAMRSLPAPFGPV